MKVTIKEIILESNENFNTVTISIGNDNHSQIESKSEQKSIEPYITSKESNESKSIESKEQDDRPEIPLPPEMDDMVF